MLNLTSQIIRKYNTDINIPVFVCSLNLLISSAKSATLPSIKVIQLSIPGVSWFLLRGFFH